MATTICWTLGFFLLVIEILVLDGRVWRAAPASRSRDVTVMPMLKPRQIQKEIGAVRLEPSREMPGLNQWFECPLILVYVCASSGLPRKRASLRDQAALMDIGKTV